MDKKYFVIGPDGKRFGPATVETLSAWAKEGRVRATSRLVDADTDEEVEAKSVAGIFPTDAAASMSAPPKPPMANLRTDGFAWGHIVSPSQTIRWLESGTLFKNLVSAFFKVASVVYVILAILLILQMGKLLEGVEGLAKISIVLGLIFQLFVHFWLVQWAWIRSNHIQALDKPDSPVLSVASLALKAIGELQAVYVFGVFTTIGLVSALGAGSRAPMGPMDITSAGPLGSVMQLLASGESGLLMGLVTILVGAAVATLVLFVAYLLSEVIAFAVTVCDHLRSIRESVRKA